MPYHGLFSLEDAIEMHACRIRHFDCFNVESVRRKCKKWNKKSRKSRNGWVTRARIKVVFSLTTAFCPETGKREAEFIHKYRSNVYFIFLYFYFYFRLKLWLEGVRWKNICTYLCLISYSYVDPFSSFFFSNTLSFFSIDFSV